jgi:hypothetical protein
MGAPLACLEARGRLHVRLRELSASSDAPAMSRSCKSRSTSALPPVLVCLSSLASEDWQRRRPPSAWDGCPASPPPRSLSAQPEICLRACCRSRPAHASCPGARPRSPLANMNPLPPQVCGCAQVCLYPFGLLSSTRPASPSSPNPIPVLRPAFDSSEAACGS